MLSALWCKFARTRFTELYKLLHEFVVLWTFFVRIEHEMALFAVYPLSRASFLCHVKVFAGWNSLKLIHRTSGISPIRLQRARIHGGRSVTERTETRWEPSTRKEVERVEPDDCCSQFNMHFWACSFLLLTILSKPWNRFVATATELQIKSFFNFIFLLSCIRWRIAVAEIGQECGKRNNNKWLGIDMRQ